MSPHGITRPRTQVRQIRGTRAHWPDP